MRREPQAYITLPKDLAAELEELAEIEGRSRNNAAQQLLRKAVRVALRAHARAAALEAVEEPPRAA